MGDKIRVYVNGLREISGLDYVDKKSMGHPCVTARGGEIFSKDFASFSFGVADGYLSDSERKAVNVVREFCGEKGLEFEVVDIQNLGFADKVRLALKGIKAPATVFKQKKIEGIPTREDLESLTALQTEALH